MNLVTQTEPDANIRFVANADDLFASAMAHPRALVVLRESRPPSPRRLCSYALRFGAIIEARGFGELRSIRHQPTVSNSTALSLRALAFHTDGSFLEQPPPRFMLSCIRSDPAGGGVSTFYPLDELLGALPSWTIDALRTGEYLFPQTYDGDMSNSWIAPVLTTDDAGHARIRWRSDDLFRPPVIRARGTRAEDAVRWLHEHLATNVPLSYAASPGETLLIPNDAMLHGRTALTSESQRELLRVWVA